MAPAEGERALLVQCIRSKSGATCTRPPVLWRFFFAWKSGSPDLISTVTDAVIAEVTASQARPLEPMYPVVFFDALRVKIRDEAVRSKAVYLALAILPDGTRDVLGIWIERVTSPCPW